MAKMNVWKRMFPGPAWPARTHEGAVAQRVDAKTELRRTVLTCLLWEDAFYEKGSEIAERIAGLVAKSEPDVVAALACEAASSCATLPGARTGAAQRRGFTRGGFAGAGNPASRRTG
jgi:hypothetical protein